MWDEKYKLRVMKKVKSKSVKRAVRDAYFINKWKEKNRAKKLSRVPGNDKKK